MDAGPEQSIVLVVLLCLSAFFSAAETALTSINKIRLATLADEGSKNAVLVQEILENPKKLLSSILIGNNLANIGATAIATSIAIKIAGNSAAALGAATVALALLILIFCEITPKTLSTQNPEKIALVVVRPIMFIVFVFTPFFVMFNAVTTFLLIITNNYQKDPPPVITEADLKTMVTVSHKEGIIEHEEKTMMHNIVEFGDYHASDVMVARTHVSAIPDTATFSEITKVFKNEHFSRLPVYHENIDTIVGVLYLKDIFRESAKNFDVKNYMREPYFTYETKPLSQLFIIMRTERIPMAVVLDEYGGTSGIVTLEDLIEKIVGGIYDEYDDDFLEIQKIDDNVYLILGETKLEDVNEEVAINFESKDYDSIGGYVLGLLGEIPEKGEFCEEDFEDFSVKFTVESIEKNRIEKVKLEIIPKIDEVSSEEEEKSDE
ncbi:membrane protein [Clostridia bacterium]|nr:membrane protein [Clostridia bacterium]